jgi:hypothetical protein
MRLEPLRQINANRFDWRQHFLLMGIAASTPWSQQRL